MSDHDRDRDDATFRNMYFSTEISFAWIARTTRAALAVLRSRRVKASPGALRPLPGPVNSR